MRRAAPGNRQEALAQHLDATLMRLSLHVRETIVLCCLEGRSVDEASREMRRPTAMVILWLRRGLEQLRVALARIGFAGSVADLLDGSARSDTMPPGLKEKIVAVCTGAAPPAPGVAALANSNGRR
jgi:hypothetical protein